MGAEQLYAEVGKRIRKHREERGLTQEALARLVALKRTSITNIEQGKQKLLLDTFWDIAQALEVKPKDLLPDETLATPNRIEDSALPNDLSEAERNWIRSVVMDPTVKRDL